MKDCCPGKIFLASERGLSETDWFRSYTTFNFGHYQNEHKIPVGPLYVLNDETLAGGKGLKYVVEEDSLIVLLPVVGALNFKVLDNDDFIQAGEAQAIQVRKNSTVEIENPYSNELINYLQLWFKHPVEKNGVNDFLPFDIGKNKNELINFYSSHVKLSIAKFDGRNEAIYKLSKDNSVFVFIIQGAFEVQNRLLQPRDGLSLKNVKEIEMEALSNEAILLIAEVP